LESIHPLNEVSGKLFINYRVIIVVSVVLQICLVTTLVQLWNVPRSSIKRTVSMLG